MIPVLARNRPDLLCVPLDSGPTGVMLVFGLDSRTSVLSEAYDGIVAEWLTEDPKWVPADIIHRRPGVAKKVRRSLAGESPRGRIGALRDLAKPRTRVRRALHQVKGRSRARR